MEDRYKRHRLSMGRGSVRPLVSWGEFKGIRLFERDLKLLTGIEISLDRHIWVKVRAVYAILVNIRIS